MRSSRVKNKIKRAFDIDFCAISHPAFLSSYTVYKKSRLFVPLRDEDIYPTDPSNFKFMSAFTSEANSRGSLSKTSLQNPPIIAATAFS